MWPYALLVGVPRLKVVDLCVEHKLLKFFAEREKTNTRWEKDSRALLGEVRWSGHAAAERPGMGVLRKVICDRENLESRRLQANMRCHQIPLGYTPEAVHCAYIGPRHYFDRHARANGVPLTCPQETGPVRT